MAQMRHVRLGDALGLQVVRRLLDCTRHLVSWVVITKDGLCPRNEGSSGRGFYAGDLVIMTVHTQPGIKAPGDPTPGFSEGLARLAADRHEQVRCVRASDRSGATNQIITGAVLSLVLHKHFHECYVGTPPLKEPMLETTFESPRYLETMSLL